MLFAVINESKSIKAEDAIRMTRAVGKQIYSHVAPLWSRLPGSVVYYPNRASVPSSAWPVVLFDTPDEPDALGYHSEDPTDKPFARVFVRPVLDNGGVVLYDPKDVSNTSVASVLSHEILETFVDPTVALWVDGPICDAGNSYALEVCDPVEADSYVIQGNGKSVSVSNFVLPAWFDEGAENKQYDYMTKLGKPFSMSRGGYMVVRYHPEQQQQQFGEVRPEAWRLATKTHRASRTARRIANMPKEVFSNDKDSKDKK